MNFSAIFRGLIVGALVILTWVILLDRWIWLKIPTQISATAVYSIIAINFLVVALLVAAPSVWGLSTKKGKS